MTKQEYLTWEVLKALRELRECGALTDAQRELWMDGWVVAPLLETNQQNVAA